MHKFGTIIDYNINHNVNVTGAKITDTKGNVLATFDTTLDKTPMATEQFKSMLFEASVNMQRGDVNCSGKVGVEDLNYLKKAITGAYELSPLQRFLADCDGDGNISVSDEKILQRVLVGLVHLD